VQYALEVRNRKRPRRRNAAEAGPVGSHETDFSPPVSKWVSLPSPFNGSRALVRVCFAPHPNTVVVKPVQPGVSDDGNDGSGARQWWIAALANATAREAMNLKAMFYRVDADGGGSVDHAELQAALREAMETVEANDEGGAIDIRNIDNSVGRAAATGRCLMNTADALLMESKNTSSLQQRQDKREEKEMDFGDALERRTDAIFAAMDADGDGTVSFEEFCKFVQRGNTARAAAAVSEMVRELDEDDKDERRPLPPLPVAPAKKEMKEVDNEMKEGKGSSREFKEGGEELAAGTAGSVRKTSILRLADRLQVETLILRVASTHHTFRFWAVFFSPSKSVLDIDEI
jgi:Ca2+-binding EF-hand superfamily protein